jgi:hypothetical protein
MTPVSLAGAMVAASWDEELSAQMLAIDVRVAEEAIADRILIDLGGRSAACVAVVAAFS